MGTTRSRVPPLNQPGAICVVRVQMTFEVSMNPEVGEQIGFRRLVMIPDPNAALPRTLWEWGVRDAS